ncbi:MAG: hypothetical protein ACFFH0_10095 [Promethearchaeota archaeon]
MNATKNSTFYVCLILGILGIILYLVDYAALVVFAGLGLIGFVLLLIAWFLFILGVRTTGL